ncbi:MAG: response regulator, partial [Treponema sp.]|nr:response regulator [Treponema sp.]
TGEEIAAIEALKAEGRSFSFGNIYSTEGFVLSDGSCTGFSPRFGELLSNLFEITFTLEFHDLNTIMNGLEDMTIDFTSQLIITPERQSRYIMSNPILQRSLAILTYGDRKIETTRDLNGLRVGILERSSVWEFITNSYPDLEIEAVPLSNLVQESGMLKSGKIDAIISISTVLTYDFSGTEFNLIYDILPLAYSPAALSTANPEFAPIISVVNKYLAAGGLDKLFELYKSGEAEYKKHTIRQILSPEERAYLEGLDKKVPIVLGTDTYPVSFYNENDGEFQGIAIDVLTEISKITGIEFEVINDKDTSWGAILEMLKTGKAALISDLIITDERKEFFIWPQTPFYSTSYAFFSKAEYPYLELYQIEQRSVAIVDWCATHQVYVQWFPNSTNIILYDSQDEALDALEKNEVDLFFNLGYILYYQKNYREKPNYKANYTFPVFNNIFFGLNINEKELTSIIDKTISYINTDKISYDWTSRSFDYSRILAQERVSFLTIFIAALLLVLFVIIVLMVNIANNKKVITKQSQKLELALEQAASARTSLEETHDILTSVLNKSDIMIYVTDKDTDEILFMNDYMKQQYEIKNDVTGIPCYKVLQVGMERRCDFCPCYELDKDPDSVITWEECNLKTKRHYRKTDRYIDWPGGRKVHIQHSVDITDIAVASEQICTVYENAPVGLTVFDENFKFIDCNEAVLKIYDVTREFYSNFFGSASHSPEFQPDGSSSRDKAMEVIKRVMDGETMRIEWTHSLPDGQPLPVELTMTRIIRDDKYVGLGYIYDMRDQIRLKKEIETALIKTQEASRAKSNFLSVMSHEMRTPMNAIIGMTSIGKKTDSLEGKNNALNKIGDASSHLLGVINDVLDMAKIEANKLELTPVEFNFERILSRVISVINFRVSEKQQQLYTNIDKNIPSFLVGDGHRLAQVVTNLLSNAVKFTSEGGEIHFNASLLCETGEHCELLIEVADNGIGVAPEHHKKLFDMFEQAESGTSRKYGGTGLGLVISKNIVELMGGKIWVESELGKGARFIFTIKLQRGSKNPRSLLSHGVNWDNVRVLAVDDDKEIHNQFNDIFDSLDVKCDTAIDGLEACRMIEERGEYDIYFIDWRMPGMDGVELTRLIKSRADDRQSVVIMITAMDWEQVKDVATRAGVDKHLLKPLFPSMIIDCMNDCFGEILAKKDENRYGNFVGKKLLLAEDIEINREILIALLEDTGIVVDWVENGEEALNKLESEPDKYDIVFMDVQMPIMDGLEATRRIRALPDQQRKSEKLPIIAMTANVFKDDVEACISAGMDDHLGKPLDIEKVLEILHKYLKVSTGN